MDDFHFRIGTEAIEDVMKFLKIQIEESVPVEVWHLSR